MPLNFQTQILPAHVRAATVGIFWRQTLQIWVLGPLSLLWLGIHLSLKAIIPQATLGMHLSLGALFWGTLLGMAWIAKRYYEDLAIVNFQRFEGAPVNVCLTATAYDYSATWGQGQIAWDKIQSLWRLKTVWVLLQHEPNGVSVVLPVQSLDSEAQQFLVKQLKQVGAVLK